MRNVRIERLTSGPEAVMERTPDRRERLEAHARRIAAELEAERKRARRAGERMLRRLEAIAAKRRRGGRAHKLSLLERQALTRRLAAGESPTLLAAEYGISRSTAYRIRARARRGPKNQ